MGRYRLRPKRRYGKFHDEVRSARLRFELRAQLAVALDDVGALHGALERSGYGALLRDGLTRDTE